MKYIQNVRLFPTRQYNSIPYMLRRLGAIKVQKYSVATDDGVKGGILGLKGGKLEAQMSQLGAQMGPAWGSNKPT